LNVIKINVGVKCKWVNDRDIRNKGPDVINRS